MVEFTSTSLSLALLAVVLTLVSIFIFSQLKKWAHSNQSNLIGGKRKVVSTNAIVSLRVYPIKSCRGFQLQKTALHLHGLELDRCWMFVDAKTNQFITIRQIPEMTLINTGLSEDGNSLVLSITDVENRNKTKAIVQIPAYPTSEWLNEHTTLATVEIWDTATDGYVYGPEVNEPFAKFLQRDVVLVYKGPTPRVLKGNGDPRILGRTQSTNFPDVHPVLIGSEASIQELNSRLEGKGVDPITIERFRPNIIVKGNKPWSEDKWKLVRISAPDVVTPEGSAFNLKKPLDLDIVARCARCQVPNVDPDTAEKHKKEPWDTLMAYRRVDEGMKFKPCFGMLSAPRNEGEIAVGMKLEVLEETDKHRYIAGF